MVFRLRAVNSETIHLDHKIGKCSHEALRGIRDRIPSNRRRPIVDFERSPFCKERGDIRSVLAAPSGRVTGRKLIQLARIHQTLLRCATENGN
jgi:hypothetical protein